MRETVIGLNLLHNGGWREGAARQRAPGRAQEAVLQHVREAVSSVGAPPGRSAKGALAELCGSPSSYEECTPSTLAPLDISLLSLPPCGHRPLPLAGLFGKGIGHQKVEEFCETKVLPSAMAAERLLNDAPPQPYNDPSLKSRNTYLKLVKHLADRGMLEFSTVCCERVGIFCVHKKGVSRDSLWTLAVRTAGSQSPTRSASRQGRPSQTWCWKVLKLFT